MKLAIIITTAAIALGACTATPQMIEAQKARCAQIGYTPGTTEHAECTERGTAQQQGTQNAVAGATAAGLAQAAIWNAIWN
jgi:starvation-inducible outer membrane lipoprotein